jgi:choline dehydrogenase
MLSGVGPGDHLRAQGIEPVLDVKGVGQNLMDHPTVVVQYACKKPVTIDYLQKPIHKVMAGARWLANQTGPAASNVWEAGGLVRGNDDVPHPNLQYHFGPVAADFENGRMKMSQAFSIHIDQLRPRFRGEVLLRSANPSDKPALHFNYLSTPHDEREIIEGVRKCREVIAQRAFDEFRGEEILPGADVRTDSEILAAVRGMSETDYHPCGTCRMSGDEDAVVDGEMRVRGAKGLRVVDASVMPNIISANLNGPTQMIAARAADFVLGRPQLPPFRAKFSFT